MTPTEKIPVWLIIALLVVTAILVAYAVFDGRRVDFWPPSIHEKNSQDSNSTVQLKKELEDFKSELKKKDNYLSPAEVIALTLPVYQKETVPLTQQAVSNALKDKTERINTLSVLNNELEVDINKFKKIDGTFLFKLLLFNFDAQCYGSSLNFTAGKNRSECKSKEELATRFLGFLEEIDFYNNGLPNNTTTAKNELIKLQNKHNFSTRGWYGPDVFKAVIAEFYGKPDKKKDTAITQNNP